MPGASSMFSQSTFFRSLGLATCVCAFDLLLRLVSLIPLDANAGRERWRRFGLPRRSVMDHGLFSRWGWQALIKASGIRSRNFRGLGVERITQCQLNVSFGAGKRKPLSVVGCDQERDV